MERRVGWAARAALLLVPLAIAAVAGCASAAREAAVRSTTAPSTTTAPAEDFVAQASDFTSLRSMTPVRDMFLANPLGHLSQAVAIAEANEGGAYPVGTIIQLVPQEAMVKRAKGFDPVLGDWEFFELDTTKQGTTIRKRGGAEIVNRFGGSCSECHGQADPEWDFICEKDHGCEPLPIGDDVIEAVQQADPRPVR